MSYIDLQTTLSDWPYDPEQISVRKIIGLDGAAKVQMRVELGVLQMEVDGRPDGAKPHGVSSLLKYHRQRLAEHEDRNGTTLGFVLSPQECHDLRSEASMYYRRFVSMFVLEEYDNAFKDTSHNLAILDLCRDHALEPEDRRVLEAYRPYVLMMDARSRAHQAMEEDQPASALAHVNRGIMHIQSFYEQLGEGDSEERAEQSGEMQILRELAKEIRKAIPRDSLVVTRQALRVAIQEERFEEAARLRDALKQLGRSQQ